jgi:SAM-dependent methyltransferase
VEDVRAANREIGRRYDEVPYDPAIGFSLDPDLLFVRAAAFGCAPRDPERIDVLDLGCGTGGQLTRAGYLVDGRLVGIDIAAGACATARARLAVFGDRAGVVCADFLDVVPGVLGAFDLIYVLGTHYITPPPVRAHLAALIGAALAPRGVVVASYYTGVWGRERIAEVAAVRAGHAPIPEDDAVMSFELLSPWLDVYADAELAAALGLQFAGHVDEPPAEGGYVFGMFTR